MLGNLTWIFLTGIQNPCQAATVHRITTCPLLPVLGSYLSPCTIYKLLLTQLLLSTKKLVENHLSTWRAKTMKTKNKTLLVVGYTKPKLELLHYTDDKAIFSFYFKLEVHLGYSIHTYFLQVFPGFLQRYTYRVL